MCAMGMPQSHFSQSDYRARGQRSNKHYIKADVNSKVRAGATSVGGSVAGGAAMAAAGVATKSKVLVGAAGVAGSAGAIVGAHHGWKKSVQNSKRKGYI